LALRTGWTPDILRELPTGFRSRCHWSLYAHAIAGEEGLPSVTIPHGVAPAQRLQAQKALTQVMQLRALLYPEDDDG
jgi:hypothetical protein